MVVGVLETSIWRSKRFSPAAKSSNALAEVVRGVGVEAEVAVEQEGIGIVVELAATQAALQAEGAEPWFEGAEVQRGHVARDFGNPVAKILRAAADGGVGVLIAAIAASQDRGASSKSSATPRLSIWPRFSRTSRMGDEVGLTVTATMGRLTWVRK